MTDPTVMFVKPGAIAQRDKNTLRKAGVIVIEIENPQDAKFIRAGAEVSAGGLLVAAVGAIRDHGGGTINAAFTAAVANLIQASYDAQFSTP